MEAGISLHAGSIVNVMYSIVDRMYIGNIPEIGALALAGVGICGPVVTLISSFASLHTSPLTLSVSRLFSTFNSVFS